MSQIVSKCDQISTIFRYFFRTIRNVRGTKIDPYKILWVNPSEITHCTLPGFDVETCTGKTISGKWDVDEVVKASDRTTYPIKDLVFYQSLRDHFVNGVPWEDTELFEYFSSDAQYGDAGDYDSPAAFRQRCAVIDNVYESIQEHGYKTQKEMMRSSGDDPGGWGDEIYWRLPVFSRYRELNEVAVNIGRNGQFLFNNRGHHRLIIAKLCEVDSIPVRVVVRHRQWQRFRTGLENVVSLEEVTNRIIENHLRDYGFSESILEHPDLRTILPLDLLNTLEIGGRCQR